MKLIALVVLCFGLCFGLCSHGKTLTFSYKGHKYRFHVSEKTARWSSDYLQEKLRLDGCPVGKDLKYLMKDFEQTLSNASPFEMADEKEPEAIVFKLDKKTGRARFYSEVGKKLRALPAKYTSLSLSAGATCRG